MVGEWSPSPLTAFPGGTITCASALPVVVGIAGCSNSDTSISYVGPPSTFARLAAGCPAPTAPDTVDCCVVGCTMGVLLGLVAAKAPGRCTAWGKRRKGVVVRQWCCINRCQCIIVTFRRGTRLSLGSAAVGTLSTAEPSPADSSVGWGGLVSPPSGDRATSSLSQEAPVKVEWVLSWH